MKTVDDVMAELQAVVDSAEGRSFTDEEVAQYEALEQELVGVRKATEIRARQTAYSTPVNVGVHVAPTKADNGLERAYDAYLRTGVPNADITSLRVTNAQGEGSGPAGGYTVPPGFRQKLVEVMKAYGGLAAEVDSFNTDTGNNVEWPTIDDTANQGDITAESDPVASGADLVFGTNTLGAYKYTSAGAGSNLPLRVSVELLQDSAFDIQAHVSRLLGIRIARKQASHWVTGTGVGQPLGLVASSLTADETNDVSGTCDYDDLLKLEALLDPAYEQNAKWVMNKATWTAIRGLLDGGATGRPLIFDQAASGIAGRPQKQLLGYPVVLDQAMPAMTSTNKFIVLGDLRESYVIRRVSNLAIVVNPYSRAANGEVEFTGWERADATVQNRSAYVIGKNS